MSDVAKPAPVARVGRYEMGAEIASGGMATVYLARMSGAAGFEKFVALKRVHPHLATEPAFVEMFLDEARIASRIEHPNVCQVFDFGEADGAYFIAMEFLVGETLGKFQRVISKSDYRNHPRRSFVCARLLADACEGLHAAHELRGRDGEYLNVVHRDISPQNLFVAFDGNTKVVDFGIASASDRLHQTMDGSVKGKFAYMAPEQARGKKVDRRADVFSLGVVLWEMLAFQRLFRRDTPAETLVALLGDPISPPSERSALAPPELDAVVLKALARDPDERYPSARELGRDLLRTLGRIGDAVDRAEVAEWLEALFPEGRRRHEVLLENARWGDAERVERSRPSSVSEIVSRSSWTGMKGTEVVEVDVLEDGEASAEANGEGSIDRAVARVVPTSGTMPMVNAVAVGASVTPPASGLAPVGTSVRPTRWIAVAIAAILLAAVAIGGVLVLVPSGDDTVATPLAVTPVPSVGGELEPVQRVDRGGTVGARPGIDGTSPVVGGDVRGPGTEPTGTRRGGAGEDVVEDDSEDDAVAARGDRRGSGRRRPQRAAAAAATGPGTVVVSTPGGWANVYDSNGRFLGDTPLTVTLPAGRHRLSLRPFGQPPSRSASVEVVSGETARVSQPL